MVVQSPTPIGLSRNGCWTFRGSQLPRALPFIFSLCCPLNDRRNAANSFLKIGRLFFLSLFSCPSLASLRLLLFLLFLMSDNVHPNPGHIFSCSVSAGKVVWRASSMLHLLQMGPSKVLTTYLSKFRALGSSHSWSCSPAVSLLVTL